MKKLSILISILLLSISAFSQDLTKLKKQDPFKFTGSVAVGGFFYNASGINARQQPYGYSLSANPTFSFYGFSVPVSVVLNEQGSRFQHPFNRFGISPEYKWIKLHLGHRNMNYSPFSVGGVNFFGVGADLTPGKLRVSYMRGRFRQANNGENTNYVSPQFERKGYMARLGLGSEKTYFDFIWMQAKDDIESLSLTDSIATDIDAHDNAVLGVDSRFAFFKNKVFIKIDGGLSAFTEDVRGYPISTEKYPQLEKIDGIFQPNISTSLSYAGEASLNFKFKNWGLAGKYRRVMPDFKSLGVNYLLDDVEAYTINPTFSLWQNKVIVSGSAGLQRNNLFAQRTSDTYRRIGSANVSINPAQTYGVTLQYSNYSLNQQVIRDTILNDSILINQISHNVSIMPRLTFISKDKTHNVFLMANYQVLDDKNPGTEAFSDNNFVLLNLTYALGFTPQQMSVRFGANYFKFNSNILGNTRYGLTAGLNKRLLDSKLNIGLTGTFNKTQQAEIKGSNFNISTSLNYKLSKSGALSFQIYLIGNENAVNSFRETRGQLRYRHRFGRR